MYTPRRSTIASFSAYLPLACRHAQRVVISPDQVARDRSIAVMDALAGVASRITAAGLAFTRAVVESEGFGRWRMGCSYRCSPLVLGDVATKASARQSGRRGQCGACRRCFFVGSRSQPAAGLVEWNRLCLVGRGWVQPGASAGTLMLRYFHGACRRSPAPFEFLLDLPRWVAAGVASGDLPRRRLAVPRTTPDQPASMLAASAWGSAHGACRARAHGLAEIAAGLPPTASMAEWMAAGGAWSFGRGMARRPAQ